MRDLPRIVADTPVGKEVDVVVIRKGKEQTLKVKIGRLKDDEKVAEAETKKDAAPEQKSVVQKTLGLELSSLTDDVRKKFKIRDDVKGVVVTGVDPSVDSDPRPTSIWRPATSSSRCNTKASARRPICKSGSTSSRAQGKKVAVLLVSNADGETRFVALTR